MKNSVKLYLGKSEDVLKGMKENSVDTIITDPPYGLSFMGKKWDYDVPSVNLWKEVLRVLKPGGTALIFAGSRTQHRMAINVEDAGFILKDCIMWIYGSGFPKATDISKQLDKGVQRIKGKLRIDGRGKSPQKIVNHDKGDTGIGHADGSKQKYYETLATTPEAKLWNGWKSHGLKPAYEPILVAMKPNNGTYANNALVHGVAGLNIDGGRITKQEGDRTEYGRDNEIPNNNNTNSLGKFKTKTPYNPHEQGRFPANVILDEEASKMLDEQSGELTSGKMNSITKGHDSNTFNTYGKQYVRQVKSKASKGGASRFFYCAKASKSERNTGCEELNEKIGGGLQGTQDGSMLTGSGNIRNNKMKNNHPTVKPLKLMEYLCTLTATPTGGIVLDPFMGSGTTGVACKLTNRDFIGIEMNEEYMKIAQSRIKNVT